MHPEQGYGHAHASHMHAHRRERNIALVFALNLVFTGIELWGGIWTGSVAILADALHDLGDTLSLGFSWFLERIARKGRSDRFSYGYGRFSLLSALINGVVLLGGVLFIFYYTVLRFFAAGFPHAPGMIGLAIAGILFNGAGAILLQRGHSLNERLLSWHLLEDVLGWVAILIGATVLYFYPVAWIDPLLSIIFCVVIIYNVIRLLRKTAHIFLQSVPSHLEIQSIEKQLLEIPGISSMHDTHIWSMDGEYHVLTTHLVLAQNAALEGVTEIKNQARRIFQSHAIDHATIEIEHDFEDCLLKDC